MDWFFSVKTQKRTNEATSELNIASATLEDAGVYKCIVNEEISTSVQVHVGDGKYWRHIS